LSAPDVLVFGELLALESIQSFANKGGEAQQHFELLEIFAYGTYSNYLAKVDSLPKLTEKQAKKLKQLTIASLASETHVIPYTRLLHELDISGLRELEDLIIDALYKDIVVGKLDHERQVFQVDYSLGRDLRPVDMDQMVNTLLAWQNQSEVLLKTIEEKMQVAQQQRTIITDHKRDFDKKLEETKNHIKVVMEHEMAGGIDQDGFMAGDMMGMMGMDRGGMRYAKQKGGKPQRARHMM